MDVKIFANNINHLTDARYFAAWGATWMCYNINSLTITEITAISEWVSGPKHIIDVTGLDPSESAAMMTNSSIDGYLTDSPADHKKIQSLLPQGVEAFLINQVGENAKTIHIVDAKETDSYQGLICDIQGSPKDVVNFVETQKPSSIILAGSEEEEVGFKSFEDLDEILESIEQKDL